MPKRERYLWVCHNAREPDNPKGSCGRKGAAALREALKEGLVERGWHKRFRVMESSCMDLCWAGPAIALAPDGVFYGHVRPEDAGEILDALGAGERVERLVLPDSLFEDPSRGGQREG